MRHLVCLALSLVLVSTPGFSTSESRRAKGQWSYNGTTGPEKWGDIRQDYWACKEGLNQSPINLSEMIQADLPEIKMNYSQVPLKIQNNGHTVQVNYGKGSSLFVNGRQYSLLQFHFHSPSEHQVNGRQYPMEAHFVHKDNNNHLAVIGVFLKEGDPNQFLSRIWTRLPMKKGNPKAIEEVWINAINFFPEDKSYFHYNGSLTTPPCSEGVRWFVLKQPVTASREQIRKLLKAVHQNARPVQDVHARPVLE